MSDSPCSLDSMSVVLRAFQKMLEARNNHGHIFSAVGEAAASIVPGDWAVFTALRDADGTFTFPYAHPSHPCSELTKFESRGWQDLVHEHQGIQAYRALQNTPLVGWFHTNGYASAWIQEISAKHASGYLAVFSPEVDEPNADLIEVLTKLVKLAVSLLSMQDSLTSLTDQCAHQAAQVTQLQATLSEKDHQTTKLLAEAERSRRALLDMLEDQRMAEERERDLQVQLNHAQKMEAIGRLAGGVAHDYNNMLSVIIGYAEMAMLKADRHDPIYSDLSEIFAAAQRSASITHQLLAFARKQPHQPAVVNLNEAIAGLIKMARRLIGEDIEIVWQPGDGIWPIYMDPSQLDQIIANLSVNARDAISGSGVITIQTQNVSFTADDMPDRPDASPGDYVCLTFSDSGCGMDADTLEHIFEPFYTTKAIGEGTGLGLATVYGIVRQNNGFIDVSSEPGAGACFRLYFTRHQGALDSEQSTTLSTEIRANGETILVVEDEQTILRLTRTILEKQGYRVIGASYPHEALQLIEQADRPIDLLLTDVIMPEMDGRTFAEQLKKRMPTLRVLYMSGYTADVLARRGVMQDEQDYLQKPFAFHDLLTKVHQALHT